MKRYETGYFFREGIRGLFLHGFMSFAAIGVIVACLLIMGSFSLLAYNIDAIIRDIQNSNEISVIIDESLSEAEAKNVGSRVNLIENVYEAVYISKDKALESFGQGMDEKYTDLILGLKEDNPLRHRLQVRLIDASLMADTVKDIEKISGIAKVNAPLEITEGILSVRNVINAISVALIVILLAVSVFIISNTVRLATFARREEIAIMRVVGATKRFIRWPFVIEGFLLGLIGAVIAFFLQWSVYSAMVKQISEGLRSITMVQTVAFGEIMAPVLLIFILTGFFVGMGGSVLTIRRFLKV